MTYGPDALELGDTWRFGVDVPPGSSATVTVTSPSGAVDEHTPAIIAGRIDVEVDMIEEGRYLAAIAVVSPDGVDVHPFTVWCSGLAMPPDLAAVKNYLGQTSATDDEITDALAAETSDQNAKCDVPAVYPEALGQALKRRVAVNLAARGVPIAEVTTFEGGTTQNRVPYRDPVVIGYEAPYRRMELA